jgi:hypothetical protein
MRLYLFALLLNCHRGSAPVAVKITPPPPEANGRLLLTEDCTLTPQQTPIIVDSALQSRSIANEVTFAFVGRRNALFLAITEHGRPVVEQRLASDPGAEPNEVFAFPPRQDINEGRFNAVMIFQGGPSFEHYTLRITGCTVELLRRDGDDLGNRTEDSVAARFTIAPRTRVWAG